MIDIFPLNDYIYVYRKNSMFFKKYFYTTTRKYRKTNNIMAFIALCNHSEFAKTLLYANGPYLYN